MKKLDKQMGFEKLTKKHFDSRENSRRLQTAWRPLSIYFDMTNINSNLRSNSMSDRVAFYDKVFKIVGQWWGGALKVNDDRSKIQPQVARYANNGSDFQYDISSSQQSQYDLLIKVKLCSNNGNALAYAGPLVRHPDTQRPVSGTVCVLPYGDSNFKAADDSVNRAVGTIIHEFGHIISFISWQNYQAHNLVVDNTINRYKWKGAKVIEVAKVHYGCSGNFGGVPLQNNNGQLGGHWSETFLSDELMTPTTGADPERVSPMTLALCEDSGWYKPDYSYTENYTYGKNNGCTFTTACPSPGLCTIGASGFVVSTRKGVGYCNQDSQGCAQEHTYSNRDCMKGTDWPSEYATRYGATYGGNCVIVDGEFKAPGNGYIYTGRQISVQAACSNSRTSYTLTFRNFRLNSSGTKSGDATVTCASAGTERFNTSYRYPSSVTCENPSTFCAARFSAVGAAKCDDTCNKNGRCQKVHSRRRRRRLQSATNCPTTSTTPATTPTTSSGTTTNTSNVPGFGTSSSGSQWQCMCYRDMRRGTACPDLSEDND